MLRLPPLMAEGLSDRGWDDIIENHNYSIPLSCFLRDDCHEIEQPTEKLSLSHRAVPAIGNGAGRLHE